MKKIPNTWLFIMMVGLVISVAALMSGQIHQATVESSQPKNLEIARNTSGPITPDLTKVDATQFLDPIPVGHKAPDFMAKDAQGKVVKLSQFIGKKNVVLIFYQGSFCPVCGHQLENVQTHLKDFNVQDAQIIAISADDAAHAKKSIGEHGLSFSVIPDTKKEIIKKYGIANITKQGIAWPSSFIVDKKGIIRLSAADPQGKRLHSSDFLPALSKITGKPAPSLSYEQ